MAPVASSILQAFVQAGETLVQGVGCMGQGVCGVAAQQCETIIVPNVHEFPGHIACDVASNSVIVVPLFDGERLLGVLDLDSPLMGRFDDQDAEGLNELATVFVAHEEGLGS